MTINQEVRGAIEHGLVILLGVEAEEDRFAACLHNIIQYPQSHAASTTLRSAPRSNLQSQRPGRRTKRRNGSHPQQRGSLVGGAPSRRWFGAPGPWRDRAGAHVARARASTGLAATLALEPPVRTPPAARCRRGGPPVRPPRASALAAGGRRAAGPVHALRSAQASSVAACLLEAYLATRTGQFVN